MKVKRKGEPSLPKRYWYVLLTYVIVQFSGLVGVFALKALGIPQQHILGTWSFISFITGLFVMIYLLRSDIKNRHEFRGRMSRRKAALWSLYGFLMAYAAQVIAAMIEINLLGVEPGSENTRILLEIAKTTPVFIFVTSIIGPILEEIVFRKVLFGTLYKKYNFLIAALVSSFIFAIIHEGLDHFLVYAAIGFTFAFLYVKTKRIIVPITAHVLMNTYVAIIQIGFADKIQDMQEQYEKLQFIIGGF
jgi:uncharacterized protein